ncbi:MAG: molecular chaperone DnaJ [Gammaproteobacteria bacterium]
MKFAQLVLVSIFCLPLSIVWAGDDQSAIGYATVEEAYAALGADPSAALTEYGGWSIFNVKADGKYILWSFTPEKHSAHPSVIRRDIVKKDGEIFINMNALCHAEKASCDTLIEEFRLINENIKNNMVDS